jgi:hypothetical protein
MKFMTLVKTSSNSKATTGPTQELMTGIMQMGMEAMQAGVMVENGGLLPIEFGASVSLAEGEVTVTDGPYSEAKEWVGGYAVYNVASKEEAVKWAVRFLELHKQFWPGWEGTVEVRQIMDQPGQ